MSVFTTNLAHIIHQGLLRIKSLKIHVKFHFTSCKHRLKLGDICMNKHINTYTHSQKEKRPLDILHAFINTFDKPLRKPILKSFKFLS